MKRRSLEVFVSGMHAGTLSMTDGGMMQYSYTAEYLGPELSVCLPFSEVMYSGKKVRAWFDNLLPDDGSVRRGMALSADVNPSIMPLLSHFGLDLPGAVQVLSLDGLESIAETTGEYVPLTEEVIGARLGAIQKAEGERKAHSWALERERWSLGGMQSKIALREYKGVMSECAGAVASNVILKPGVWGLKCQALDECITMRLAKLCSLPVADVEIKQFAGIDAIVVRRYDRYTNPATGDVTRIHQEDLCQATGTVSSKKYAMDGGPSSVTVMNILEGAADNSRSRFVDALLFNYFTASTDAHAKNYSILHPRRGEFMLAPLYDVASAAPYMEGHKQYRAAMSIGGENRIGWLRKTSLAKFAKMHGFVFDELVDRADELAERVKQNLEPAVNDFAGIPGADELASRLIPRVRFICDAAQRNIRVDPQRFKPRNPARLAV